MWKSKTMNQFQSFLGSPPGATTKKQHTYSFLKIAYITVAISHQTCDTQTQGISKSFWLERLCRKKESWMPNGMPFAINSLALYFLLIKITINCWQFPNNCSIVTFIRPMCTAGFWSLSQNPHIVVIFPTQWPSWNRQTDSFTSTKKIILPPKLLKGQVLPSMRVIVLT